MTKARKTLTEAFRNVLVARRARYSSWAALAKDLGVTNKIPESWATGSAPRLNKIDEAIERDPTLLDDLLHEFDPESASETPRWERLTGELRRIARDDYDLAREIVSLLGDLSELASLPLILEDLRAEARRADFIAGKAVEAKAQERAPSPPEDARGEKS